MAIAATKLHEWVNGDRREKIFDVAVSGTYASSGGEAAPASLFGFKTVHHCTSAMSSGGYTGRFDPTNNKFTVFYGDNNNAADGPLIEVPSGALSETFRVRVVGR